MASYEESATTVVENLAASANAGDISEATQAAITAIVNTAAGATGGEVKVQEYTGGTVDAGTVLVSVPDGGVLDQDPGAGQAIIMASNSSANVTFSAESTVQTLVLGAGGSNVVFETSKDVTVELSGGEGDTITLGDGNNNVAINGGSASITTGDGNNNVTFNGGDASITTGDGHDTITLNGGGNANITGGSGNMVVKLQSFSVAATIDAGDGFDQLMVKDSPLNHLFQFINGLFQMHSDNPISMKGVNVVGFDTSEDGQITNEDRITVLAENQHDSLVAKLYKVALGRQAIDGADGWSADGTGDTLGGINWWMNEFEKGATDGSTDHLVRSFLNCAEFHSKYDDIDDAAYVAKLFENLGTTTVNGRTAEQIVSDLDRGAIDRYEAAWEVASSEEAIQLLGNDGEKYVIDADFTNA